MQMAGRKKSKRKNAFSEVLRLLVMAIAVAVLPSPKY